MSWSDHPDNKQNPLLWLLATTKRILFGLFLGWFLTHNYFLHTPIRYRFSFYGYEKVGNQVYPIIKLRKNLDGPQNTFHFMDDGIPIEIGLVKMDTDSKEFTDKQINDIIRQRYCK